MARRQTKYPIPKDQEKQPQSIKQQQAPRRSLRLQAIRQSHKQFLPKSRNQKGQTSLSPSASTNVKSRNTPQPSQISHNPSTSSRKRKRGQEQAAGHTSSRSQEQRPSTRPYTSPPNCINKKTSPQQPASDTSQGSTDPLKYWSKTGKWPKEYFEQDSKVREDFERGKSPGASERLRWQQKFLAQLLAPKTMHGFAHLDDFHARQKSFRQKSQSTLPPSSEQPSRETKGSQYNYKNYESRLEQRGSYMRKHDDIDDAENNRQAMKTLCKTLLETDQTVPQDSLFRDDLFEKICEKIRNRNEAIIVQDITRLIVPSAMNLAIYGAKHLRHLEETVIESWSSMIEYEGTLPQPDYSVGFGRSAFTQEQLNKLEPFVGKFGSNQATYVTATPQMYFPFLTCEVKCGAVALDVADRQNAQSMSIALRALVVLFRLVKRENELDRDILVFSVSHDHSVVRIYGHYPVIQGDETTFYRHPIRKFDFFDGENKWTAYKFTKNVYDFYMPKLYKLICSAIDDLPADTNCNDSQSASLFPNLLRGSQQSHAESVIKQNGSQSNFLTSHEVTPTTSSKKTQN